MSIDPKRRLFLNAWAMGAAAASISSPWRGSAFAQTPKFISDPFTLGVASGDPTQDGFVLWTRLAPEPLDPDFVIEGLVDVMCEISEDEALTKIVRREFAVARPDNAHAIHVEVSGLKPNRPYFYRFRVGLATSPIGRTRTTPEFGAPLNKLRFAWHSCSHYEQGLFTAYGDLAKQNPDVILSLGDYIYEVSWGAGVRRMPVEEAYSLKDYRLIHSVHKLDMDLQAAHAVAPWLYIWDDHEVANDYQGNFGKILPGQSVETDFPIRKYNAYKAFFEHQPLRARSRFDAINRMRIYGQSGWGDLLDFTLLDTRQYRSKGACLPPDRQEAVNASRVSCAELQDSSRTILGTRQERFVNDNFMRAPFKWSVLVQPTLFSTLFQKSDKGDPTAYTDGWSGYEPARQKIIDLMVRRRREVSSVVIGGDMHGFWASDVKQDYSRPESDTVAVEFVGGSITSQSFNYERWNRLFPDNPHLKWQDDRVRGYGLIDVDPQRMDVRLMSTPTTWRRDQPFSPLKRFVVERGKAYINDA
ncbi:alkaline phosphatase D family protein [Candidatus Phycosocius spiralis]|uniref:Alkaline phosphatase D n=1 Tax=Candidatus Phycosocius spiralis TaxID=2815099 RepID=A0ABQ4PTS9_9PROT|nr:alkaline phosphatase D family protein [Candidatus Phycosocius spiralis]GIU66389.1 alkaline phosphatase D [Candidatus Phycosocius spiralis]